MPTNLINVSNRLPVTVAEDGKIQKSSGGLVAALEGLPVEEYALHWIGWPGGNVQSPDRQQRVARQLNEEFGCTPVFFDAELSSGFYEGLSNSSLWPLLHYMPSKFRYQTAWWDAYREVNERFADQVVSIAKDDDLVWVHDYQLMLLPGMLRHRMPSLRIGFFLHTPFPSYEVFRLHPDREELIAGLLGADLLGFHTFGYARHFRSSVLRLLGIESEITRIRHNGGHVTRLGVYPIGINAPRFEEELNKPELRERIEAFRRTFDNKQLVLSVERLDYTKGILHRLDAIDEFLSRSEVYRNRIKFIFVSVPSRENVPQYRELIEEVEARVGHINGRHTTLLNSPIHFIHGKVDFTELTALYAISDVAIVTPLIDGMNLVAKEYVASQRDNPGVLILSEFAGAAQELFNAVIVNPYDTSAVADALEEALAMPREERATRMAGMRERVMDFDAAAWARTFVGDLAHPMAAPEPALRPDDGKARLRRALRERKRVAMFLDYDGTLREIESDPGAARPNEAVTALLDRLQRYPGKHLDVTIISGRTPQDLESFLGNYSFGLIAEHGAFLRRPHTREWEQLDRNTSYGWKEPLLRILRQYQQATPGSFIEDKRTSLVWHYRRADPEFGGWRAKELAEELSAVTANEPVQVRHGRKIVEVTAAQINKGAAVMHVLGEAAYDVIVCAGDDTTDESMFRLDLRNVITIKVGDRDTMAQYRLPSPKSLRSLLEEALAE